MTNLVHARRRLVSRHVTMVEAMKMIVERDDADVHVGYYLIFITHLRQESLKSAFNALQTIAFTQLYTLNSKIFNAIR